MNLHSITLLLIAGMILSFSGRNAFARNPVPFENRYRDGLVLTLWNETYSDADLGSIMDRIRQTKARHLTLPWFGCQTSLTSSDVGACEVRSRNFTIRVARLAAQKGFDVSFLPIVVTPDWQWRGFFEPKDVAGWFASYQAWINGIADDARALGMKELVVGSEFTKLYRYTEEWKNVLRNVRAHFSGPLIVATNWGGEEQDFWDEADAIGVSAYYPLSRRSNPSQAELDRSWASLHQDLVSLSRKSKRPIHITEVGYPSVPTAAKEPWSVQGNQSDLELQAKCYDAFRKSWQAERALARVDFWSTGDLADPGAALSHELLGKPALDLLNLFFMDRLLLRK